MEILRRDPSGKERLQDDNTSNTNMLNPIRHFLVGFDTNKNVGGLRLPYWYDFHLQFRDLGEPGVFVEDALVDESFLQFEGAQAQGIVRVKVGFAVIEEMTIHRIY